MRAVLTLPLVLLGAACGGSGPNVDYASQLVAGSWSCPGSSPFGASLTLTAASKNLKAQWLPELILQPTDDRFGDWPPPGPGSGDDTGLGGDGGWSGYVTMTLQRSALSPEAQIGCTVETVTNDDVTLDIYPQDADLTANTLVEVRLGASDDQYCPIDWQGLCELAPSR